MKVIESSDLMEDIKWLIYWVVFSMVNFLEIFFEWILLYFLLKFFFFVWCMFLGLWSGMVVIYNFIICFFVMRYRNKFDIVIC